MKMENEINMEEQILEADKLYNDGDYAECKRILLDILDQEPGFGRAHDMIGCLYLFVLDDPDKAVKHMKLAVKFDPSNTTALINCTRALNYRNRHTELMEITSQALKVESINKCIIFSERGKSFEKCENVKAALENYYEAEKFAITDQEVEIVKTGIKRLKRKSLRPIKKLFWFNLK
jgi:tetratricopeptide (TPR) repeat protein